MNHKDFGNDGENTACLFLETKGYEIIAKNYRANRKEIDIILYMGETVNPIEIKKGAAPKEAVKNFSVLKPIEKEPSEEEVFSGAAHLQTKIGTGAVICMPADIMPIDKNNWYVPAWIV